MAFGDNETFAAIMGSVGNAFFLVAGASLHQQSIESQIEEGNRHREEAGALLKKYLARLPPRTQTEIKLCQTAMLDAENSLNLEDGWYDRQKASRKYNKKAFQFKQMVFSRSKQAEELGLFAESGVGSRISIFEDEERVRRPTSNPTTRSAQRSTAAVPSVPRPTEPMVNPTAAPTGAPPVVTQNPRINGSQSPALPAQAHTRPTNVRG